MQFQQRRWNGLVWFLPVFFCCCVFRFSVFVSVVVAFCWFNFPPRFVQARILDKVHTVCKNIVINKVSATRNMSYPHIKMSVSNERFLLCTAISLEFGWSSSGIWFQLFFVAYCFLSRINWSVVYRNWPTHWNHITFGWDVVGFVVFSILHCWHLHVCHRQWP